MKIWFDNGKEYVADSLEDPFMRGFNANIFLRDSCYTCPFAKKDRVGDITIGDFWGLGAIEPFPYDTKKGISFVMSNSTKGDLIIDELKKANCCILVERSFDEAAIKNHTLTNPMKYNSKRAKFFKNLNDVNFVDIIMPLTQSYYYNRKIGDIVENVRNKILKNFRRK